MAYSEETRTARTADANDYDPSRSRASRTREDRYDGGYYDAGVAKRVHWERWLIPVAIVLLAVVGLLGAGVYYAMQVSTLDTIYPNVTIDGVNVGGMTRDEAIQALGGTGTQEADASVTVRFSTGDSLTITAAQLGMTQTNDAAGQAAAAYSYGRSGSLLSNLQTYIACKSEPVEVAWDDGEPPALNETLLHNIIDQAAAVVSSEPVQQGVEIRETEVLMTKGAEAVTVDTEALCAMVKDAFESGQYGELDYTLETAGASDDPTATDTLFQQLYDRVHTEPENAYIDSGGAVVEGKQGVSFDVEQAKLLWDQAAPGQQITVPLTFTDPEVMAADLNVEYFQDLLAEKSTTLAGSTSARINNITLAAQALNGTVINPGEEFNYNQCLGERTTAKGYQSAGAFSGGQHVMSIGGGICQGSSTLYYCALKANLRITTRWCHQFLVTYLPRGLDATVSWGWPDFKFVNSRDYPIKIEAYVSGGYLTIRLWGTDVDGSYVEMTSEEWEDATHYYAQTYRNVYDRNGNLISSTKEAYSSYDKEGVGGTSSTTVTATPAPQTTPPPQDTGGGEAPPPPPVDTGGGDVGGGDTGGGDVGGGDTGGDVGGGEAPPPPDTGGGDVGGGDTGGSEPLPDVPAE